jgi:hypothetical protein
MLQQLTTGCGAQHEQQGMGGAVMDEKMTQWILRTEIVVPKMVIALLSATLTRLTFSIDIVIHLFIKLLVVTWNLNSTSTPACHTGATVLI